MQELITIREDDSSEITKFRPPKPAADVLNALERNGHSLMEFS